MVTSSSERSTTDGSSRPPRESYIMLSSIRSDHTMSSLLLVLHHRSSDGYLDGGDAVIISTCSVLPLGVCCNYSSTSIHQTNITTTSPWLLATAHNPPHLAPTITSLVAKLSPHDLHQVVLSSRWIMLANDIPSMNDTYIQFSHQHI